VSNESLYDKYGGFSTVAKLVNDFYDKIGNTQELDIYFNGIEMSKLIDHQTKFLCSVLGGPEKYEGRELKAAHQRFNITAEHFDLVASLLKEALEDNNVEDSDVATIVNVVWGTKPEIVKLAV
jgi:hemoglobin